MALIKCNECVKEISDLSSICINCGAPLKKQKRTDFTNIVNTEAIKSSFFDFKEKASNFDFKEKASKAYGKTVKFGKEAMRSQAKKDTEDLDVAVSGDSSSTEKNEELLQCEKFKAALESTIDVKIAEVLATKDPEEKYLNYMDAQTITSAVRNIFKRMLGASPSQINAVCSLSEAILAPSKQEKQNLIKSAVGAAGGAAGIGMIIAGIGVALGWGAGVVASVSAVFVGSSVSGPVGWIAAGVGLAALAGYFATTSNKHTDTERFIKVIKAGSAKATDAIWQEHSELLSGAMNETI